MERRGRPSHPDILTPREHEVLSLLREGLTNPQIADRLGITLDGVKYHVSEILSKLGLGNRHDAARWAEGQGPRQWSAGALAPLMFWRRLDLGWLSPAIAGGLVLAVAAGLGLLIWGLLATRGEEGPDGPSAIEVAAPTVAYLIEQAGDPAEYDDLRAVLRAIDAGTGRDIPGYPPYDLGHHAGGALSPDGTKLAVAAAERSGSREHVMIFDLDRWEPIEQFGLRESLGWLQWSPNGDKLYVKDRNCCATSIFVVDMEGGETERFNIPLYTNAVHLSPDGSTLYFFGIKGPDRRVVPEAAADYVISPALLAVDTSTGEVNAEVELREVVLARATEVSAGGYPSFKDHYIVGAVMSPDGQNYYIAHADGDKITVIDLATMQVQRTAEIDRDTSLFGTLRSFFVGTAYAKSGGISGQRVATISADGRYLYVSGNRFVEDEDGEDVYETLGVRVIDTRTLREVSRLQEEGMPRLRVDPAGRYLYRLADGLSILDPTSFEVIAHRPMEFSADILIGQAPGGSLTPPQ